MAIFDKFRKGEGKQMQNNKPDSQQSQEEEKTLSWIPAAENRWGIDLLDLRPISTTMLSTSKNPEMATNAASFGAEDGCVFWNKRPNLKKAVETNIAFPIDKKLYPGVLYNPGEMEQKWAIYFDGIHLYFIRSWHREVFVVAETKQENNQLIIQNIQGTFLEEDDDKDITEAILTFLLVSHALNEIAPAPLPINFQESPYEAGLWSFSAFGNMAHIGTFDSKYRAQPSKPLRTHSLLHIATARGNLSDVRKYRDEGMDINALAGDGLAPLHWAISSNILSGLIELGAEVDVRSTQGATPLMNAVQSKNIEQVNLLIEAGADINAADYRGFTSLHRAAEMGLEEIVKFLLNRGVDKDAEAQGYTALSLAEQREQHAIIELLKK